MKNTAPLHARKAERLAESNKDEQQTLLFYLIGRISPLPRLRRK